MSMLETFDGHDAERPIGLVQVRPSEVLPLAGQRSVLLPPFWLPQLELLLNGLARHTSVLTQLPLMVWRCRLRLAATTYSASVVPGVWPSRGSWVASKLISERN